jgi:hypothetical protein
MVRDEILRSSKRMFEASQQVVDFQKKVSAMGLGAEIEKSAIVVKERQDAIQKALGIDGPTLGVMFAAAVAISGRESTYGKGRRYQWTNWAEVLLSQSNMKDASIGPTQVKYGEHFGKGADLAQYGFDAGIVNPSSLNEYPQAITATIGILSKLYSKAKSLGYTTNEPGVASKAFTSTGNAALDIALIGYNMGDSKITNYCGADAIKKPCPPGSKDIVKNYIPNFVDGDLTSLGYVSEVSKSISRYATLISLF